MLSTSRMSNRECGIALQKCGADPGRVVDADEDRYRDSQFALRFLLAALHEGANARDPLNFSTFGVLLG